MNYHFNAHPGQILKGVKGWVGHWDSRCKTVAVIIFVFGVISLTNPVLLLVSLVFAAAATLWMGISKNILKRRLLYLLPFLLLMAIPLLFGGDFPPLPERILLTVQIALKALTAMTAMVALTLTQPVEEYLEGLAAMKIPPVVLTILFLAYRYLSLFVGELKNMQKALVSRLFRGGLHPGALATYGELSGILLLKSLDRSEAVYRAMVSRGFVGTAPFKLTPQPITQADLAKLLVPVIFIITLLFLEKTVI